MKKISKILVILIILILVCQYAIAGDAIYRMMHEDDGQDGVIIATIIDEKDDIFILKKNEVISGTLDNSYISLDKNFKYYSIDENTRKPQVKDYVVASIKKDNNKYKIAWGAFLANGANYKTLKLYSGEYATSDVDAVQYYINSKGNAKEYSFKRRKVYYNGGNEGIDITGISLKIKENKVVTAHSHETQQNIEEYKKVKDKFSIIKLGSIFFGIVIIIFIIVKKQINNK